MLWFFILLEPYELSEDNILLLFISLWPVVKGEVSSKVT